MFRGLQQLSGSVPHGSMYYDNMGLDSRSGSVPLRNSSSLGALQPMQHQPDWTDQRLMAMENELRHLKSMAQEATGPQIQMSAPAARTGPGADMHAAHCELMAAHRELLQKSQTHETNLLQTIKQQQASYAAERKELMQAMQKQQADHRDLMQQNQQLLKAHLSGSGEASTASRAKPASSKAPEAVASLSDELKAKYLHTTAMKIVSNETELSPPAEPTLMDNILLYLPERAVHHFGLEPNMDDKGDDTKELWFGRVWELRQLLAKKYADKLKTILDNEMKLTEIRKRELELLMKSQRVKELMTKLAARWKGAAFRSHCSLKLLDTLKYANIQATLVYAHGSGGCSWDNFRICRMIARMGVMVIAPDGFAYPANTAMGQMRHKDIAPLHKSSDDVDYWANDLLYTSSAVGTFNYSTKAEKVLQQPAEYKELYEKCYQLRRSELHFTCARLPNWVKRQGFFTGGTSEGAMTIARFDDQRYGQAVLGRFINSFSIEYCYFTPTSEAGQLGGNRHVPTLNIIGTRDQYFGVDGVAGIVARDADTGYGDPNLTGNGFETMKRQDIDIGLVALLEDGVHSPCNTHDNFMRQLFQVFFSRPHHIWMLQKIWREWSDTKNLVEVMKTTKDAKLKGEARITQVFVPKSPYPNKMTLRQVEALQLIGAQTAIDAQMQREKEQLKKEYDGIDQHLSRVKDEANRLRRLKDTKSSNYYSQDTVTHAWKSSSA